MGGPSRNSAPTPTIPSLLHSLDETSLRFVINHVFLPPALPTKSDRTPKHEGSLIRVFRDCAETFARHSRRAWDVISRMLLCDWGVEEDQLEKRINVMKVGGEHSSLSAPELI